ncbi:MAG: YybH family protein [Telluria sp.]
MSDEQQIRQLVETWISATQAGDIDAVLSLMTEDVVFMSPGQPPMVGREAFARGLNKVLAEGEMESTSEVEEVVVCGDLAYCRTKLAVTIISKHGKLPILRSGETLTILRKGPDGQWRVTRDANMLASAA